MIAGIPGSSLDGVKRFLWIFAASAALPSGVLAQEGRPMEVRHEIFVNTEIEQYLRVLQVVGAVPTYPWSMRSFSPREIDRLLPADTMHPWRSRYRFEPAPRRGPTVGVLRPEIATVYNTAFPYGFNNGPVWAGRGATTSAQLGAAAEWGPVSLTVAPNVFWAQNADFDMAAPSQAGVSDFAHPWWPDAIDLPQRFGAGSYARIDAGQSTLRVDLPGVSAGVSTANQHWGPAVEQPILVGNNAPGFVHAFVGTSEPINLWVARVHARAIWGQLEQSSFSPMAQGHGSRRLMSGYTAVVLPRGIPGLELGLARFFHEAWPIGGLRLRHLGKPFEVFLKETLVDLDQGDLGYHPDNQLASVFARWVFPRSGFELYGEYGREDHNWDLRDFFLHPDHDSAYLLGFRKVWPVRGSALLALRGEILNTAESHLKQVREQAPFYVHRGQLQGHTHRGQVLGAATGLGGGGAVVAGDFLHPGGRTTIFWRRELQFETGQFWWDRSRETLLPEARDVINSLGAETLVFRGRWDVTAGLTGLYNMNRHLGSDRVNLHGTLRVRAGL